MMKNVFRVCIQFASGIFLASLCCLSSGAWANTISPAPAQKMSRGVPATSAEQTVIQGQPNDAMHPIQNAAQPQTRFDDLEYLSRLKNAEDKNKAMLQVITVLSLIIAVLLALLIFMIYRKLKHDDLHLKELNLKLKYQAKRDPLTGLLNRRAFFEAMKRRRKSSNRRALLENNALRALIILDVDQYKIINDTFGQDVGDIVLIEVSHRLSDMMRENDKLMRWGQEEFLMYLNSVTGESLNAIVERALVAIGGTCIDVDLQHLNVTVSVGYVLLEQGEEPEAKLDNSLKLADAALYRAKIDGRNQAIGIRPVNITNDDLDEMPSLNLDELITQEKVAVTHIAGPVHAERSTID